jgi:urea transport system permease protein
MSFVHRGGRQLLLLSALWSAAALHADTRDEGFLATLGELREAEYSDKAAIVERLVQTKHPSLGSVLTAFLEGRLFFRNDNRQVVVVKSTEGDPLTLLDPLSMKEAGTASSDALTSIGTNNSLRRMLRTTAAQFALNSEDRSIRLEAVRNMLRSLDDATVEILRERHALEKDTKVRQAIAAGIALAALDGADSAERLKAVEVLRASVNLEVRNRLAKLAEKSEDGTFAESDEKVRIAAASAVSTIDGWRKFYSAVETSFFGLSLGSVLLLIAMGLAITFGVVGVINMAHGELMMLGAYTTYTVQLLMPNQIGWSIFVAIPAAFAVAGLTGVLMERTIIRWLYGRPLETLLATFGVSLILQQAVRSIFSANNRSVVTPGWMSGSLTINDALSFTYNRLYIVMFAVLIFATVLLVMKRTRIGLDIRAVSQNRPMAKAMGIRTEWVDVVTFGLGSGIAGVSGVALSQLTNVGPNLGQAYIIDSFMVVVFGGVGNLWGALVGGASLGIVNNILEPYAGAVLAKIFVLVGLILFIQRRPRGLFPPTGRATEDR